MTLEKRMIERIQPDVELVSAYLETLKQQFPDVPSSQLFDAAVKTGRRSPHGGCFARYRWNRAGDEH